MNYDLVQVDAFTSRPLEGNACAVLPDARGLDDATMLRIARENNLSETSFVFPGERSDFRVRYFTPTHEIPMAGHPTIATTHALCELGIVARERDRITIEMPAGIIPVTIDRTSGATRYIMRQPAPKFLKKFSRAGMAPALGIQESALLADVEPQTVSTGTPQLMIALRDVATLARLHPDPVALFPEGYESDYFSVHVFARERDGKVALRSRHYALFGNIIEDPFTGSASGGMAAYCAQYELLPERSYAIAQGDHAGRPGIGYIRVLGSGKDIEGIEVGGEAVTVLRGTLTL